MYFSGSFYSYPIQSNCGYSESLDNRQQVGGISFPPTLIQKYFMLKGNPTAIQEELAQPKVYAVGCEGRPTLIITNNPFGIPNVFLMFVVSSDPFGHTVGFIFPTGMLGRFPTSQIMFYDCAV
ncbi:hypothetical protein [Peribacillus frigoritolerans]|uniref:hypothetical protein n=1 Tax=Peribacillus frigoritolerans TaxID=450367 RepID=UPI00227DF2B7|nr:hypothetical protein [Peribacillus frigoritolerans]MCY9005648.1 hypothetical protein [Peribacillus frigoritolerans]